MKLPNATPAETVEYKRVRAKLWSHEDFSGFNPRLATMLNTLDSYSSQLQETTARLKARLDEHERIVRP
jgi:hypothetical protein